MQAAGVVEEEEAQPQGPNTTGTMSIRLCGLPTTLSQGLAQLQCGWVECAGGSWLCSFLLYGPVHEWGWSFGRWDEAINYMHSHSVNPSKLWAPGLFVFVDFTTPTTTTTILIWLRLICIPKSQLLQRFPHNCFPDTYTDRQTRLAQGGRHCCKSPFGIICLIITIIIIRTANAISLDGRDCVGGGSKLNKHSDSVVSAPKFP